MGVGSTVTYCEFFVVSAQSANAGTTLTDEALEFSASDCVAFCAACAASLSRVARVRSWCRRRASRAALMNLCSTHSAGYRTVMPCGARSSVWGYGVGTDSGKIGRRGSWLA